ncbi:MAG: hypothetical protein ACT4P8_04185 [Betaproteobacteria bacterium]
MFDGLIETIKPVGRALQFLGQHDEPRILGGFCLLLVVQQFSEHE